MNKYESHKLSAIPSAKIHGENVDGHESAKPLIENDVERLKPPMARPEVEEVDDDDNDDDDDDRDVAISGLGHYPGIDDGFFTTTDDVNVDDKAKRDGNGDNSDAEIIPPILPRAGGDGEDERDGPERPRRPSIPRDPGVPDKHPDSNPVFPYAPGFGFGVDLEPGLGGVDGSIPDVNVYQHKKTIAQGMMDLALFSANANQLRYVLESNMHPYYYPSLVMISISLAFQVAVGVGLIWNSRYNVNDERQICIANKINNFTIIGIFLITVINVFISAFGVANIPPANP